MNRIWFGAALLVILLALGLGSSALMERTHLAQAENLTRAAALALQGDWAGAEKLTSATRKEWDRKQSLLAALSDHEPMDQVEGLLSQLEVFAGMQDAASFSSTCVYLARQLEALGKSHSLNLPNFF